MQPSTEMAHASANAKYGFILGAFSTKFSGELSLNALPNGTGSHALHTLI